MFPDMTLAVGDEAPDFELPDQDNNKVQLSSFRGSRNVVVVFYPFSFTGVCTGELCQLRDDLAAYERSDATVLAVSCDSRHTQRKFAEEQGYSFGLLSDFWPHGQTARAYGVFDDRIGAALRGTFVIDKSGLVSATFASPDLGTPRDKARYEEALAGLS
jgi:peroxiredoxin